MKVLVTGGAGFLGRHFAMHHAEAGDEVTVVDDFSSPYAYWPETDTIRAVEDDAEAYLDRTAREPHLLYHFAAPVGGREKIEGDPLFNADSLRLDAALFRWATKHPETTIVYPSSSAVYGVFMQKADSHVRLEERYFKPWDENSWPVPDQLYGFTKMVGEVLAWRAAEYGVNTLCIRPFSGYGEDQSLEYPMPSIIKRIRERQDPLIIWGDGEQARDFIHVDDIVAATVKRLAAGVEGYCAMNIGTGEPVSFNALALIATSIEGYNPRVEHLREKPVGVSKRYCDPTRMLAYHTPKVTLVEGVQRMLRAAELEEMLA